MLKYWYILITVNCGFVGPKLYVKPSQKSNRHIIVNAVCHCVLAGVVNADVKNKVLEVSQGLLSVNIPERKWRRDYFLWIHQGVREGLLSLNIPGREGGTTHCEYTREGVRDYLRWIYQGESGGLLICYKSVSPAPWSCMVCILAQWFNMFCVLSQWEG